MDTMSISASISSSISASLTIFIISDSLGDTAAAMATAAASQFEDEKVRVERLPKISTEKQVGSYLDERGRSSGDCVAFVTITAPDVREKVFTVLAERRIQSVDLLGPAIDAISKATGSNPVLRAGINRKLDEAYFRRIEAMDYSVDHDDGRLPEEYCEADIVLMGVSRTSKTPLSMYLASAGYKVANLPLALGVEPPKQIYDVERWRIFGLMSSPKILADIRARRLGDVDPKLLENYAGEEYVTRDLDQARAFMRKIGCIIIRTDNRAIEDTAREILTYYERAQLMQLSKDLGK